MILEIKAMPDNDSSHPDDLEQLFLRMQAGDEQAFARFWADHYDRLLKFAQNKIGGVPLKDADDEDIVLCALNSFFRGVCENRFADISEAKNLWKLLATLVSRKLGHHREKQLAQKRGGGDVRGESVFLDDEANNRGFDAVADSMAGPDLCVEFYETSERLFDRLDDDSLRRVARWIFEGYTINEVAERLQCTRRSVERKLQRIRSIWSKEMNDE